MKTYNLITLLMALVGGGTIIIGLAYALGKADEKVPITEAWEVNAHHIHGETTNGQVMLRRQVNVDAARQRAEDLVKGLDGVKDVKNDLGAVAPSTGETVEESHPLTTSDLPGRAGRTGRVRSDRMKLLMIYTLYLDSKRP